MYLPNTIISQVKRESDPFDNRFFRHSQNALNSMKKVTDDTFCYDDISRAINTLERIYKGFLEAAQNKCDWYSLPSPNFLDADHDILGMVLEIKQSFPEVFPRMERQDWRDTKNFLKSLRVEYTDSRYSSYPNFAEFQTLLTYVQTQNKIICDYIKLNPFDKENNKISDYELDY